MSATEIYNYIIENYNSAVKSIKYNKKFIKENCSFENNIDKLLKKVFNLPQIDCDSLYLNYSILKYYGELFVREVSNGTIIINDLKDINSKLNAANNELNNINTKLLKVCDERLELINNLLIENKNLYEFWSNKVAQYISSFDEIIINLCSKEYSKLI